MPEAWSSSNWTLGVLDSLNSYYGGCLDGCRDNGRDNDRERSLFRWHKHEFLENPCQDIRKLFLYANTIVRLTKRILS